MTSKGNHNQYIVKYHRIWHVGELAVLEDPLASANKNVVDLVGHGTHITAPCPTMRFGAPEPGNPQSLGPGKIPEKEPRGPRDTS